MCGYVPVCVLAHLSKPLSFQLMCALAPRQTHTSIDTTALRKNLDNIYTTISYSKQEHVKYLSKS